MHKKNKSNSAIPRLSDFTRPSVSINREIISANNAPQLGELFDKSFNARIGVLSKNPQELERLTVIAEELLAIIPKEKLPFVSFVIVDNEMDLRNEVFASPCQKKIVMSDEQHAQLEKSAMLFLQKVIQNGCVKYASHVNKDWNKDELRNELEKMKEHVIRLTSTVEAVHEQSKPVSKPLLFTKKKGIDSEHEKIGNLKNPKEESAEKDDKLKLLFTAPRAREDSLPSDLIKNVFEGAQSKSYSFLDLLAADGYETKDLETFEEQVILKLDRLKEHILHQFNPVFNELNVVRKHLRQLAEHTSMKKADRKSIMK